MGRLSLSHQEAQHASQAIRRLMSHGEVNIKQSLLRRTVLMLEAHCTHQRRYTQMRLMRRCSAYPPVARGPSLGPLRHMQLRH